MSKPITPLLAVDIIIQLQSSQNEIILIERRNPPYGWALPGGFVDVGETVEHAAIREAREETSLEVKLGKLLGVYSDPHRDPRGHCVSIVFTATAVGIPCAKDDAINIGKFSKDTIPAILAFDHAKILADYFNKLL